MILPLEVQICENVLKYHNKLLVLHYNPPLNKNKNSSAFIFSCLISIFSCFRCFSGDDCVWSVTMFPQKNTYGFFRRREKKPSFLCAAAVAPGSPSSPPLASRVSPAVINTWKTHTHTHTQLASRLTKGSRSACTNAIKRVLVSSTGERVFDLRPILMKTVI